MLFLKLFAFCLMVALLLDVCMAAPTQDHPFDFYDESFNLLPHFRASHSREKQVPKDNDTEKLINFSGSVICPKKIPSGHDLTKVLRYDILQDTSTCPWFWQLSYDATRTPDIITTAKCSCQGCRGQGHPTGSTCQELYYFRKVIYHQNTTQEKESLFRVAVGCTCEERLTQPSQIR